MSANNTVAELSTAHFSLIIIEPAGIRYKQTQQTHTIA